MMLTPSRLSKSKITYTTFDVDVSAAHQRSLVHKRKSGCCHVPAVSAADPKPVLRREDAPEAVPLGFIGVTAARGSDPERASMG